MLAFDKPTPIDTTISSKERGGREILLQARKSHKYKKILEVKFKWKSMDFLWRWRFNNTESGCWCALMLDVGRNCSHLWVEFHNVWDW